MAENSKEAHAKANLMFTLAERQEMVQQRAKAEYEAEGERRRIKSSTLRGLRLAKEAADIAAGDALPPSVEPAPETSKK